MPSPNFDTLVEDAPEESILPSAPSGQPPTPNFDALVEDTPPALPTPQSETPPAEAEPPLGERREGVLGSLWRPIQAGIFPAAATAAGGTVGRAVGVAAGGAIAGAAGLPTGPGEGIAVPAGIALGGAAGDIAAGTAAGYWAEKLQETIRGPQWAEQNRKQEQLNLQEHPIASRIGSFVPVVVSMLSPGAGLARELAGVPRFLTDAANEAMVSGKPLKYWQQVAEHLPEMLTTGARAGASSAAQQGASLGGILQAGLQSAVTMGPTAFIPGSDSLLRMTLAKAPADAAVLATSNALYNTLVNGQEFDFKKLAEDTASDIPGFVLFNLFGGLFHNAQVGSARSARMDQLEALRASPQRKAAIAQRAEQLADEQGRAGLVASPEYQATNVIAPEVRPGAGRPGAVPRPEFFYPGPAERAKQQTIGGINASSQPSAEGLPVPPVREGVGPTPPLRQPGTPAGPGAQTEEAPPEPPVLEPPPPPRKVPNIPGDPGDRHMVPTLTGRELPLFELGEHDPSQYPVGGNFKLDAKGNVSGVIPGKELKGPYDRTQKGAILVWERLDGTREVWGGRHKNELFAREKAAGRIKTVPVQLVREKDGWTEQEVKIKDIETNIHDNQGSIYDYANVFWEIPAFTYEVARQRGLLRDAKAVDALAIARNASKPTFDEWIAQRNKSEDEKWLTNEHALAIAKAAPNNEPAQKFGRERARQGADPVAAANQVRRAARTGLLTPTTDTLPGFGDERFENLDKEDAAATRLIQRARRTKGVIAGGARDPKTAADYGIDVKDPDFVNKAVAALNARIVRLQSDWWLDDKLRAEVEKEAGTEKAKPAAAPAPRVEPVKPAEPKLTPEQAAKAARDEAVAKAQAESEKKIRDAAERIKNRRRDIGGEEKLLSGAGIDQEDLNDLAVIAVESAKYGYRGFVQKARQLFGAGPLWDYIKRVLHSAWSNAAENNPNISFEDVNRAESNRIIDEVISGKAPAAVPPQQAVSEFTALGPPQKKAHRSDPWVPFAPGTDEHAAWTRLMEDVNGYVADAADKGQNLSNNAFKSPGLLAAFMVENGVTRWEDLTRPMLDQYLKKQLFNLDAAKVLGAYQVGRKKRGKEQKEIKGPSQVTGKNLLTHLRWFLQRIENKIEGDDPQFFQKHQRVSTDPALAPRKIELRQAEEKESKGYFTYAEMERMLAQPGPDASLAELQRHALFEFLAFVGPRGTEPGEIKLKQLDLANNSVLKFLQPKLENKDTALKEVGRVMLPEVAVDALRRYIEKAGLTDPEAPLFPFDTDKINEMIQDFANAQNPPIRTVFGKVPSIMAFRDSFAQYLREPQAHPEGGPLSDQDRLRITRHASKSNILEQHYENPTSPEMKLEHLVKEGFPHAEAYSRKKHENVDVEIPEGPVPAQHLKLEVKPEQIKRKLKAKAKGPPEKELLPPKDMPFNLTGPEGEDPARLAAEKAAKEKAAQDKADAEKNHPDLFGENPPPPTIENPTANKQERFSVAIEGDLKQAPDTASLAKARSSVETARLRGWITEEQAAVLRRIGQERQDKTVGDTPGEATESVPAGMSREAAQAAAAGENTHGFNVNVITHDQARRMLKKDSKFDIPNAWGGFFHKGEIWLIHNRLSPRIVKQGIREEAAHGLLLSPEGLRLKADLLLEGKLRLTDDEKQSIRGKPGYGKFTDKQVLEEFIAKSVRENRTWLQSIYDAVRAFLAKHGMVDLTNAEVARLLLKEIAATREYGDEAAGGDFPFPTINPDFAVPGLLTKEPTGEDVEGARVHYAAAEPHRIVADKIADRLAARSRLEGIAYDEQMMQRFTGKREGKLGELVNAAERKIAERKKLGEVWAEEDLPSKYNPNLADILERLGINFGADLDFISELEAKGHDMAGVAARKEALAAAQNEIQFERKASSLMSTRQRLNDLLKVKATLAGVGIPEGLPALAQIEKSIKSMSAYIAKMERDDNTDNELGMTIDERAQQLAANEARRPDDTARSNSLNFEDVQNAFMGEKAFADKALHRFNELGKTIQDFNDLMDAPPPADPEEKAHLERLQSAAAATLFRKLYEFDLHKAKFERFYDSQRVAIAKSIGELHKKLGSEKIKFGLGEIMLADAVETANGERGLLADWRNAQDAEFLRQSYGVIKRFALGLREAYPNGGARAVLSRIMEAGAGQKTSGDVLNALRGDPDFQELMTLKLVEPNALQKIVFALTHSRDIEDAVNVLLDYGDAKLAADPTERLRRIEQLLDSPELKKQREALEKELAPKNAQGVETPLTDLEAIKAINKKIEGVRESIAANTAEAQKLIRQMKREATESKDLAQASMKVAAKELERQQIALQALEYANEMFDSVTHQTIKPATSERLPDDSFRVTPAEKEPNPHYMGVINRMNSQLNIEWRPITSTGAGANRLSGNSVFYHPFNLDVQLGNERLKVDQPLLVVPAEGSPLLNKSNFLKVRDYFNKAEDFIAAVDEIEANGLSPARLGIDLRVYDGLKRMLAEQWAAHQDNTAVNFLYKKSGNAIEQSIMFRTWFLQHLATMKQLAGPVARQVQYAANEYFNGKKEAEAIGAKYRQDFDRLRTAALESHRGEYGGGKPTLEDYEEHIFSHIASQGRRFTAGDESMKLKPGMWLPAYGKTVTKEDLALLNIVESFLKELRQRVTEQRGHGIIEERGSLQGGDYHLLVRRAAGVGEHGLPMHRGKRALTFQKEIQDAYKRLGDKPLGVETDLGPGSTNPVIQFWNQDNGSLLRQHLVDAGRGFRAINQTAHMVEAERKALAAMVAAKDVNMVQTVEDAVALITQHFPDGTGLDKRAEVTKALLDEFEQYRRLAGATEPEAGPFQKTESIGGLKLGSEFTERAAQFIIPSGLYDYGVLTDTDYVFTQARALHEQTLEYGKALERLGGALQAEIDATVNSTKNETNYRSMKEAQRIRETIRKLSGEFKASLNLSDPDVARTGLEFPPAVIKQSLLANPPVPIRNIILGLAEAYLQVAALDTFGRSMAMLRVLGNGAGMVARVPLHLLFSPSHALGRQVKGFLEGPGRSLLPSMAEWVGENIIDAHDARVKRVQELGYSARSDYLKALKSIWAHTNEFTTREQAKGKGLGTALYRTMRNLSRSVGETYRLIGTEGADLIINAQWLSYAGTIEKMLRKVALEYVTNRQNLGRFDASNPAFLLKPNEFSNRLTYAGRQQNLAELNDFLVGTNIPLEKTLWDYGQKLLKNEPAELLSEDQWKDLQRAVLRSMNASDASNRPVAATNSKLFRMLATYQGYPADFLGKFIRQFAGARNESVAKMVMMSFPTIFMYGMAAAAIGLASQVATDEAKKRLFGSSKRMVNALDKEFWTDWSKASDAMMVGVLSTIPLFGDAALYARDTVVNNRGYEPTGRVLAFGIVNAAAAAVRGMWNLRTDPKNMINPLRDFILQYAGYGQLASRVLGLDAAKVKEQRSAESIVRYAAQQAGLAQNNPASAGKSGLTYTATSGYREDLTAAMVRRDPEALQSAYKQIVDYYAGKGIEDPEKNASRDFRANHPIVRAFGKKPTDEEWGKVYSGLTDDQKKTVDQAVANWDWAASQLGVSYEPISAGKGGGGGGSGGLGALGAPGFTGAGAGSGQRASSAGVGGFGGGAATAGFSGATAGGGYAGTRAGAASGSFAGPGGGGGLGGYGGGGGVVGGRAGSQRRLSLRSYLTRGRTSRLRRRSLRASGRSLGLRRRSLAIRRRRLSLV